MAKNEGKPPKEEHTVLCLMCADEALMTYTKRGKPTIFCPHCLCRLFLNSAKAEAGYFLNAELVMSVQEQHKSLLGPREAEIINQRNAQRRAQAAKRIPRIPNPYTT